MLRARFARFRSLRGESAMELIDRLSSIVDRLRQRGFDEISDRDVVDKLLNSVDESYATVISEIKERPDFEELRYAEIMTLLSIHEEKFGLGNPLPRNYSEEGEILSDYGSSHESEEYEEEVSKINIPWQGKWRYSPKN